MALAAASRQLAELKGVAASIPRSEILINALGLQEAKDSSAIENIVTTHDELFRDSALPDDARSLAAKEVLRYRQALKGYRKIIVTYRRNGSMIQIRLTTLSLMPSAQSVARELDDLDA